MQLPLLTRIKIDRKNYLEFSTDLVYSDQAVPDYYSTLFSGAARLHTTHL